MDFGAEEMLTDEEKSTSVFEFPDTSEPYAELGPSSCMELEVSVPDTKRQYSTPLPFGYHPPTPAPVRLRNSSTRPYSFDGTPTDSDQPVLRYNFFVPELSESRIARINRSLAVDPCSVNVQEERAPDPRRAGFMLNLRVPSFGLSDFYPLVKSKTLTKLAHSNWYIGLLMVIYLVVMLDSFTPIDTIPLQYACAGVALLLLPGFLTLVDRNLSSLVRKKFEYWWLCANALLFVVITFFIDYNSVYLTVMMNSVIWLYSVLLVFQFDAVPYFGRIKKAIAWILMLGAYLYHPVLDTFEGPKNKSGTLESCFFGTICTAWWRINRSLGVNIAVFAVKNIYLLMRYNHRLTILSVDAHLVPIDYPA